MSRREKSHLRILKLKRLAEIKDSGIAFIPALPHEFISVFGTEYITIPVPGHMIGVGMGDENMLSLLTAIVKSYIELRKPYAVITRFGNFYQNMLVRLITK